jgi:hypothetical protein
VTTDGRRRPPRPRIELVSPVASESEAAAIVAAVEQFLADTAPAPTAAEPPITGWQRAALEEGVGAPELGGGWKPAPGWRGRG